MGRGESGEGGGLGCLVGAAEGQAGYPGEVWGCSDDS